MKKRVTFVRIAARKLVLATCTESSEYVKNRVLTEGRTKLGWRAYVSPVVEEDIDLNVDTGKVGEDGQPVLQKQVAKYSFNLEVVLLSKRARREDVLEKEWNKILEVVKKALHSKKWNVEGVENLPEDYIVPGTEEELLAEEKAREEKAKGKSKKTAVDSGEVLENIEPAPVPEETVVEV